MIKKAFEEGNIEEWEKLTDIRDDEDKRQILEWYKGFGAAVVSGTAGVLLGVGLVVIDEIISHKLGK